MPKFYVTTGTLSTVIDRRTPFEAAIAALRKNEDRERPCRCGQIVEVNESGGDIAEDSVFYLTETLLEVA